MKKSPDDLPLLSVFYSLRTSGLQLTIDDYLAVLKALEAGFGGQSYQDLAQLCCTVWAKSLEETEQIYRLFNRILSSDEAADSFPSTVELPPDDDSPPNDEPVEESFSAGSSELDPLPEYSWQGKDSIQVVQALRQKLRQRIEQKRGRRQRLVPKSDYFPVNFRQAKQNWRQLRSFIHRDKSGELDVAATVEKISRQGFISEPEWILNRSNQIELVLLVDWDGSMVPFHELSQLLIETAKDKDKVGDNRWFNKATIYYFHNYPDRYLYDDPVRLKAKEFSKVLSSFSQNTVVLIFSDAGAARGSWNERRLERTKEFIQKLAKATNNYAWLNPVPSSRWFDNSAGVIAKFIPMFEVSQHGMSLAVKSLRSYNLYSENTPI